MKIFLHKAYSILTACLLLLAMLPSGAAVQAAAVPQAVDPQPDGAAESIVVDPTRTAAVLLLVMPEPQELRQAGGSLDFTAYVIQRMQPVVQSLHSLLEEGLVARWEEDYEAFAIRVWMAEGHSLNELPQIPDVAAVQPVLEAQEVSCTASRGQALRDMLGAARMLGQQEPAWQSPVVQSLAAPTIHIYISSYLSYGTRYATISGATDPGIPVKIVVTGANGAVVVDQTVQSYASGAGGEYLLSPSYQNCLGYGWSLSAGQTVTVTAGGATRSFQIPLIDATVMPGTDRIVGKTAASRRVQVNVNPTAATCSSSSYAMETTSGADGGFQLDLTAHGGLDNSGRVDAVVYDAHGNSVVMGLTVPGMELPGTSQVWAYVSKPGVSAVVSLRRGGGEVERVVQTSDSSGYVSILFNNTIVPGDTVMVDAGAEHLEMQKAALQNLQIDWQNGQVRGRTAPGLRVHGAVYTYANDCPNTNACDVRVSNVSGDFVLTIPRSHLKQSSVYLTIYDSQGNSTFDSYSAPRVLYQPNYQNSSSRVSGDWLPGVGAVTLRIRNGSGVVEEEHTLSVSYRRFSKTINRLLPIGYVVEVTDGSITRQVTVQEVTIRHDSYNNVVLGTVPQGGWLDVISNVYNRPGNYYYTSYSQCDVPVNPDGSFQASQPHFTTSEDIMDAWKYDEDGDAIIVRGYDLHIALERYTDGYLRISGYKAFPFQPVNVTIRNAARAVVYTTQITETPRSQYYMWYNNSLLPGYTIDVTNGAVASSLYIPALTINEAPAENRVYGQSPANEEVYITLWQFGAKSDNWRVTAYGNAQGNYSASFAQIYNDYNYKGCVEGRVGGCREAVVEYYDYLGHHYTVNGPYPAYVAADTFDTSNGGDNTPDRASVYQAVQHHTFHNFNYDPDWIAVQIPAANVGKLYSFQTLNVGDGIRTDLQLYDSNQTTLLADYSGSDDAAVVRWSPTHAGWYYVKVTPRDHSGGECGSTYDFRVQIEADWTVMLYLNGDNDLGRQIADLRLRLEQIAGSLASVNVLVLYDGMDTNTGDTWRLLVQPSGRYQDGLNRWYMGEMNLGDGQTLSNFIRWGMENYPASSYFLSVIDHGQAVNGLSWDFNTSEGENSQGRNKNFSNSDLIEPMELREAIWQGTNYGANKIDVLYYDTCLMGLWEVAYQVKDAANYLIFSQNEGWAYFPYEQYLPALRGKDPRSAAVGTAGIYSTIVSQSRLPYTVSVIDLAQIQGVTTAVDSFAGQLSARMNIDKEKIKTSRDRTQVYDSTSDYILTTDDTFLDLYDFAGKIKEEITDSGIRNAATAVQAAVRQAVIAEHHGSGLVTDREGDQTMMNLDRSNGLSIYFPSRSGRFFAIYNAHQMFATTTVSAWDEMLSSYYGAMGLPPYIGDPDDTNPVIFRDENLLYLPLITR